MSCSYPKKKNLLGENFIPSWPFSHSSAGHVVPGRVVQSVGAFFVYPQSSPSNPRSFALRRKAGGSHQIQRDVKGVVGIGDIKSNETDLNNVTRRYVLCSLPQKYPTLNGTFSSSMGFYVSSGEFSTGQKGLLKPCLGIVSRIDIPTNPNPNAYAKNGAFMKVARFYPAFKHWFNPSFTHNYQQYNFLHQAIWVAKCEILTPNVVPGVNDITFIPELEYFQEIVPKLAFKAYKRLNDRLSRLYEHLEWLSPLNAYKRTREPMFDHKVCITKFQNIQKEWSKIINEKQQVRQIDAVYVNEQIGSNNIFGLDFSQICVWNAPYLETSEQIKKINLLPYKKEIENKMDSVELYATYLQENAEEIRKLALCPHIREICVCLFINAMMEEIEYDKTSFGDYEFGVIIATVMGAKTPRIVGGLGVGKPSILKSVEDYPWKNHYTEIVTCAETMLAHG